MNDSATIIAGALRCSLGTDKAAISNDLIAGQARPVNLTLDDFPGRDFPYFPLSGLEGNSQVEDAGRLHDALVSCALEALEQAGLDMTQRGRTGLFLGSSSFDIGAAEQHYGAALALDEAAPALPHFRYGDLAHNLRSRLGLAPGEYTFSTACTSSANALLSAVQAVNAGWLRSALVVGVEFFNRTTLLGFDSLQLLSPSGYHPFDRHRAGLVLGEGVGAVVVAAQQPLPTDQGWDGITFLGGANGCDPEGLTCSSAESMARVMEQALNDAGLQASQLALIKAHGTGSESNDAAEAMAMQEIFDRELPPLTTLKGALGHTLGASGVLELVALLTCLKAGKVPPTSGFSEIDPALGCRPVTRAVPFSAGKVMLNYFGFGGNNTSLILEVD